MHDRESASKAVHLLSVLKLERDGSLTLNGTKLAPLSTLPVDPSHFRITGNENVRVRISYNPIAGIRSQQACRVITYRKTPFAFIGDRRVLELETVLRRLQPRRALFLECGFWYIDGGPDARLWLPEAADIDELIRLIRLNQKWPIDRDALSHELFVERRFDRLACGKEAFQMEFSGTRHAPPLFLLNQRFWTGKCQIVEQWPEPGSRRVPRYALADLFGQKIVAVKPHDALYRYLQRHAQGRIEAAAVVVLPEGRRKPLHRLVVSASAEPSRRS